MNRHAPPPKIAFIDLAAQKRRLGDRVEQAIQRVLDHCQFVLGPEVKRLEAELSAYCGALETISCANGTDALALVLMAKGVKPGDAVLCPSFTFAATAEVVAWLGATPVFVDVDETTYNLDLGSLKAGIQTAKRLGLAPKAIIPVDLFGQPADYDAILPVAEEHGLWVLSDAAQSFGATYKGRKVGTFGLATTTSFFPAKPLGCYGDGGAIFTDDAELADLIRSLRVHGQNRDDKYDNVHIGMNGRLDTIQAAVLIEKLAIFPEEVEARNRVAARYAAALADVVVVPQIAAGSTSVWAQYTIRLAAGTRDRVAASLHEVGVPTAIYYPKPLHRQTAYAAFPCAGNALPVSDRIADEVLALPMHPYLDEATQDRIVAEVRRAVRA
jgi:dTDP-4-amino-4,6-dideoxygalactose transaminase